MRASLGDHLGHVFGCGGCDRLADGGGRFGCGGWVPLGPLPALRGGERAGQDAVDTADRTGLHRVADVRATPGPVAVVTGARAPADRARVATRLTGDDRAAAVPHQDQSVRSEDLESCPDDAGADALRGAQFGDRRQHVARGEAAGLDGVGEHIGDLLRGRTAVAGPDHQIRNVAMLDERPAGARQVAAALQPRVQLVEDRAADLPHFDMSQSGLDGTADEALVGLPRGHVPRSNQRVLIQECRDGGGGLRGAALGSILKQPAELDARLPLGLGGGLEADGTPGERIGPDVYGDAVRPARQLLYVTFAALGMT